MISKLITIHKTSPIIRKSTQPRNQRTSNPFFSSCVDQVFDFTTAFLFALEGQTTIGYGFRSTTEECPIAIILQFIQFLTAIALDSLVVTIVFTKVSYKLIKFSKGF